MADACVLSYMCVLSCTAERGPIQQFDTVHKVGKQLNMLLLRTSRVNAACGLWGQGSDGAPAPYLVITKGP